MKEKLYCVYCGVENDLKSEKCKKCDKPLHPKNQLFKEFLYNHIRSDLKGKLTDSIFSYIKNFIISHLYGTVMSLSIIFALGAIISSPKNPYKTISSLNELKKPNNSSEVTIKLYTYDDSCYGDFDPELANTPFATAGAIISGNRMTTEEITIKNGTTLADWCKENEIKMICAEELFYYDKSVEKAGQTYREKVLDYAAWVKKNGTNNDKEYARRNLELDDLSWEVLRSDNKKKYDKTKPVNDNLELVVTDLACKYWS